MISNDVRRAIDEVKQGATFVAGEFTLASSGTTTTITRAGVSASSVVSLTPYTSAARTEGIPQIVPGNGSFVCTHTAGVASRTYRYVVHTPQ